MMVFLYGIIIIFLLMEMIIRGIKRMIKMKTYDNSTISNSLEKNITSIKKLFKDDDTLNYRQFKNSSKEPIDFCVFFIDSIVSKDKIEGKIINPIMKDNSDYTGLKFVSYLKDNIISSSKCKDSSKTNDIVKALVNGNTVLFVENINKALILGTQGGNFRSIEEPESEKVTRGPREGFSESLETNISLIRRKIKTNKLKFKYMTVGDIGHTNCCICYIESLASQKVLDKITEQINEISIDGVLDGKYIQEYIDKQPFSLFETTGTTERPDVVAAKLLEGRLALIVDGSPVAMTFPFLFIEIFQFPEDYYLNYYFASMNRIMRLIGFITTISAPAIYLALVNFHQELIPTPLLMSIYAARLAVPLPTIFELIFLLVTFEVLREASMRMNPSIGPSLSIVGALVLGTAAVEAKLVSAPVIIIVGLSGITGFMIPSISGANTIIKLLLLTLASILGLYGYIMGIAFLLIHLTKLKSFGVPIMSSFTSFSTDNIKDTHFRAPRWMMTNRPEILGQRNPIRSKKGDKK